MSIGLYDADMISYNQIPFNIDIMKLSTYFKNKKEIVVLNTTLEPERYTKFFYYQDFNDVELPSNIFMMPNVEYGGRVFNPNKFVPLPPDIEKCVADTSIYDVWRRRFINNKTNQKMFVTLQNTDHLRLSIDGKTIKDNALYGLDKDTLRKNILIHDYDISAIDGVLDYVKEILDFYNKFIGYRTIGMKFPVQLYKADDVIEWNQFRSSGFFYNIQYNGILTDEELDAICLSQLHTTKPQQFVYNVTPEIVDENDFYLNVLPHLVDQMQRINTVSGLQLHYNLKFFKNSAIIDLLEYINNYGKYIQSIKNGQNSMYDYAKGISQQLYNVGNSRLHNTNNVRELFRYVRDTNYPLFEKMYQRHKYYIEGGKIHD